MKRIILAALATMTLVSAPTASADNIDRAATAICQDLAANPVDAQVEYDVLVLTGMGLSIEQAAKFMVVAVSEYCPEYLVVLKHYARGAGGAIA